MHSVTWRKAEEKELDQEWMDLIKEAKNAGLTVKDVRRFFNKQREGSPATPLSNAKDSRISVGSSMVEEAGMDGSLRA
ncbi:anti-repressor SinI family protein [Virgibacillus kimchii]